MVLAASLAAVALAACSSGGSSGSSGNGKVTLTYAMWDQASVPAEKKVIAAFEKANPNISVKIELTPWDQYWQKLQAAATGGSTADVLWMNPLNIPLYAANGILLPLDKRIAAAKIDLSAYDHPDIVGDTWHGQMYSLPRDDDLIGLWYNKKLFDAAGVKYPDSSWTWNDAASAAAKLTDKAKGIYGIAASPYAQSNYYDTIYQAGGQVISSDGKTSGYNTPEAATGFQYWADLIKQGSSPTLQQMTDTEPTQSFLSGKIAMLYAGNWQANTFAQSEVAKDIDVAVLPQGQKRAVIEVGLSFAVSAKSSHADESWKLTSFLASPQAQKIRAAMQIPPAYKAAMPLWLKSLPQYNMKAFVDERSYEVPYPISQNTLAWENLETPVITKVWSGKESAAAGGAELAGQMNAELSKEPGN
jgi:multiple sugar transport system substrate-binding protein